MTDTFCPVPWNFQAIQNNGAVRVCCQMNAAATSRGTLRKDDGTVYQAGTDDLAQARNAQLIREVRSDMMQGKWHSECVRCMQEEQAGIRSRRQWENQQWQLTAEQVAPYTSDDGTINTDALPIVYYDLRFGNFCNLACRMCGPEDSHTWYKDWVNLGMGSSWKDTHGEVKLEKNDRGRWVTDAYDWHGSETFWDQIENNITNIEHVYMAGGEPLLIERHYEFLKKCIDLDVAKNIILEYNTNLTNLQQRVLDLWTHFKQVRVGASIDGMNNVLEYQRYPAKWSTIERNLRTVDQLPDNVMAWLAVTVTNLNCWQLPDFMLWKLQQGFTKINNTRGNPIIQYHVCHRPWTSSIRILTPELKQQLRQQYDSKRVWFNDYDDNIQRVANRTLDSVLKFAEAEDASQRIPEFVKFTNRLDSLRKQDIRDVVPEYINIFS